MMTESLIDYLVLNTPKIPEFMKIKNESESPTANYKRMYTTECNAKIHFGNPRTDKFHIVISGETCRELQHEHGTVGMLKILYHGNATYTRCDLCITQFLDNDGLVTIEDVQAWYIADMIKSKHVKHGSSWFEQDKPNGDEKIRKGKGFYIGDWNRRAKHGIVRAYDKGLELDLGEYLMTRIEVEEKRKDAQVSVNRIMQGNTVNQVLQTRFDVSSDYFQEMLDCEPMDVTRGKKQVDIQEDLDNEKRLSRWNWLNEQVAPALAQAILDDELAEKDHTNYINFMQRVKSEFMRKQLG